ncbi:Hypothetical Protein SLY_0296 [Strawberry lethal yellows phytoplasma (CPA) str. NZSb11]|uniref:Uncharacterized protein n=1 Tax=Strawberry lethal yellows phytoplasma (CPA) str. NZSb11 TaxID=980422 RepID=R4S0D1_PHYAS|nr:Hypothetical Protein SLY_0296 [Strawberry lethal yellows phytoplasma (CPA) str. NZSb11]
MLFISLMILCFLNDIFLNKTRSYSLLLFFF